MKKINLSDPEWAYQTTDLCHCSDCLQAYFERTYDQKLVPELDEDISQFIERELKIESNELEHIQHKPAPSV